MRTPSVFAALGCTLLALNAPAVRAQVPAKYKLTIQKGLDWLARHQNPRTGHWEGTNGQYPVSMTGLAGTAPGSAALAPPPGQRAGYRRRARHRLQSRMVGSLSPTRWATRQGAVDR